MDELDRLDTLIDQGLDELPLMPVPSGLTSRIMAQIEPAYVPEPFQLPRVDFVLAGVLSFLFGFGLLFLLNWTGSVDVGWISAEFPAFTWLTPTTTLALIAVPVELLVAYMLFEAFSDEAL